MLVRADKSRTLERDLSHLGLSQEVPAIGNALTLPPIESTSDQAIVVKNPAALAKSRKAAAVEEKRKKLVWQTAMYDASLQNGFLRLCWDEKMQCVSPILYDFQASFGMPLKALRLIGIGLTELPLDFAPHLVSLEILSLANNKLVCLPDNVVGLTNLKELNLMYNKINRLPERIGYMCSLLRLGIANNELEVLPVTFGALNLMERVDLEHNVLTVLPENLDNMLSCRSFNVNNNKLTRLPRCVGRMPSLTSFSASCNALTYIPSQFTLSPTLTCLRLNVNQITHLPDRFGDLTQLVELNLDYNKISKLPHTFWKLSNLKTLRMEGNETMLDPPPEIMGLGGAAVVAHLKAIYLNDKVARMREVVLATQNVLKQIAERDIADSAYFEPDFKRADKDLDRWFALQLPYLWRDLIPQLKKIWEAERAAHSHRRHKPSSDDLTAFDYSEQEVMLAFTNYSDAVGPVLRMQKAMFRRCACVENNNITKRKPCVPPAPGYMCMRDCVLLKSELVRERDKHDRLWQLYKSDGMRDAMKRADYEAKLYLDCAEGQLWLEDTAYEQAEEVLLDSGANVVIEKRFQQVEKRKKALVARYEAKKNKVQKVRDRKIQQLEAQLETLKEDKRLAKEGYVRSAVEQRIQSVTINLAHLPETAEIQQLQADCERECALLDEGLFDSDSVNTSEVDSSDFSSEDESPAAVRWRERLERRDEALRNRNKLRQIRERFNVKEEIGKSQLAQAKHLLDTYVVLPVVEPINNAVNRRVNKVRKKMRRGLRQIVEVATIRTRKLYLKFNGHFDEVQRELKYEIYRQYVDHHVAEAKEKAKHEFAVIESVRTSMAGMGRDKAFRAWKFWVVTKKRRMRKDLRKQWKMATRGFDAAMHSVTSAQFQVDLWVKKKDIYTDKIYWRNDINGKITYDRPGLHHYLPPNFAIPVPPKDLPEDIPLMTSSSEDSQDEGWLQRYEDKRRQKREQDALLKLALNSRAHGDSDDSSSSSSTESRSQQTSQSTVSGGMKQFLHVARQSMIAAASLSASTEHASIGFESSSVPAEVVPGGSGNGSEGKELSRITGQAFSVKEGEKESDDSSDSGSSGSSDSGSDGDGEDKSGATSSNATSSRATSVTPSVSQSVSHLVSQVPPQAVQSESNTARTQSQPQADGGNAPGGGADMSQSVITYTGNAESGGNGASDQYYYTHGSALDVSQSQSQAEGVDAQYYDYGQSQSDEQLQVYDPNAQYVPDQQYTQYVPDEQYVQYWDESSQQYLYWDNLNQQYQYWDEQQQQYLIYDAYEQAVVPSVNTEDGGVRADPNGGQLVVPASARSNTSARSNSSSVPSLPPLLLTERPQSGVLTTTGKGLGKVLVQRPPRYDFRRQMAEFSLMYDENEEVYVGAPDSATTTKLQEAVALARDYIKNNSLYLQRQQLLAIGGGQAKNQSRRKSATDKKAAAHQAIDLYAKPSNLDEEAAIVRQKAFQEYEKAFKAIRKKRNQLNPERHHTYMRQVNRKPKSLEMILGERVDVSAARPGTEEQIAQQMANFTTSGLDGAAEFRDPTEGELLQLAGGELDMVYTGKPGMELRTVLAQRALHVKRKLEKKAVEQHLMVAKNSSTFWGREIRPLFMKKYQGSSSEEEDADEDAKLRKGKEARKKLRKARRADKNFMAQKLGSPAGEISGK